MAGSGENNSTELILAESANLTWPFLAKFASPNTVKDLNFPKGWRCCVIVIEVWTVIIISKNLWVLLIDLPKQGSCDAKRFEN